MPFGEGHIDPVVSDTIALALIFIFPFAMIPTKSFQGKNYIYPFVFRNWGLKTQRLLAAVAQSAVKKLQIISGFPCVFLNDLLERRSWPHGSWWFLLLLHTQLVHCSLV